MSVTLHDLGKRVRARFSDGSIAAEGQMISFTETPSVGIRTDPDAVFLKHWRADMCEVIDPLWGESRGDATAIVDARIDAAKKRHETVFNHDPSTCWWCLNRK